MAQKNSEELEDELAVVPWYFCARSSGFFASLADETPSPPGDVQADIEDVAMCIHRIEAATHFEIRRPLSAWAGLRCFVHDGEMALGTTSGHPNFIWCAGQGGFGIQTAPAAARVVAASLTGEQLPRDLTQEGLTPAQVSADRLNTETSESP